MCSGSGYIGLEFADVYTALGSEVTFVEAMDTLMPTFGNSKTRMPKPESRNPNPNSAGRRRTLALSLSLACSVLCLKLLTAI